ncbi:MAG: SGNH/GDSL hydrolase family protein [Bacteroidales bacterium]|nr:SGNH/GDSL hydrolase family protein [Bacteroidales bacterium]
METSFKRTAFGTVLFFLLLSAGLSLQAQVFTDASFFPVYGKASEATKTPYQRLPAALEGVSRDPVWSLGTQSAGLYIRFRSNSTAIHARWTSTYGSWLTNMCPIGVRGLDLYILVDGQWRPAGVGRPSQEKTSRDCLVKNMTPEFREYMLYLSLYDGIDSLEIGVDEGAVLEVAQADTPRRERPVVMYGTSILQGCSASRPGMAHTNIISRALDREVINLGFSGNALLDLEIARLMASVPDPAVFVLDYAPNAYAPMIREHGEEFFRILRDAHPDVPVIFIEDVIFPHTLFDSAIRKEVEDKNFEQRALFERLKKQGEKGIYFIPAAKMTGPDGESTADTIHLTDLGMQRYADLVLPVIRKALRKARK